eukprot:tig00000113_g5688.t1
MVWWRPPPPPPPPKTTFYTFKEDHCKENTRVDVKVVNNAAASKYQVGNDLYFDKIVADFGGDPCTKSSGVKSWGAIGANGGWNYACQTCPVDCTKLPGGSCKCDCVYELGDAFDVSFKFLVTRGSDILYLGSGYKLNECNSECREDAEMARRSGRAAGVQRQPESQAKKVMDALFRVFGRLDEDDLRVTEEAEAEAGAGAGDVDDDLGLLEAELEAADAAAQLQLAAGDDCGFPAF